MSVGFGGAVKLTGESSYRQALREISQDLKELSAETKLVTAEYGSNDKSLEALTAKQAALNKQYEAQEKKVKILKDQYAAMTAEQDKNKEKHAALLTQYNDEAAKLEKIAQESGKTSKEYQDQAQKVSDLSLEVNKSTKTLDQNETSLSKMRIELTNSTADMKKTENETKSLGKQMEKTGDDSTELGKDVEDSGKKASSAAKGGFTVLKGILADLGSTAIKAALKGTITAVTGIGSAFIKAANDTATAGDSIAKDSQKLGFASKSAYQEWKYVLDRTGTDITALKKGFVSITTAAGDLVDASKKTIDTSQVNKTKIAYEKTTLAVKDAKKAYKDAVKEHGKNSSEAQKAALKVKEAQNKATDAQNKYKAACEGSTPKISGAASAIQSLGVSVTDASEKMRSQEDIFADVIKSLSDMDDASARATKAQAIFAKSFTEIQPLLNSSAGSVEELKQKAHDLGLVMSDEALDSSEKFKDSLDDLKASLTGIRNNLMSQFLPALNDVTDGLTSIFTGTDTEGGLKKISDGVSSISKTILENAPAILSAASTVFTSLLSAITGALPKLASTIGGLINQALPVVVDFLKTGLPVLISGIEETVSAVFSALPEILPVIFGAVSTLITDFCNWLSKEGNVKSFLNSLLDLTTQLMKQLADLLPIILPAVFSLISEIADFMTDPKNLAKLTESLLDVVGALLVALGKSLPAFLKILGNLGANAIELFVNIGKSIGSGISSSINSIKKTVSSWIDNAKSVLSSFKDKIVSGFITVKDKVFSFVSDTLSKLGELPSKMVDIGRNAIEGIIKGVKNTVNKAVSAVKDAGKAILNGIKNSLGIHSPSSVFADVVGKNMALGIEEGFSREMAQVSKDMQSEIPTLNAGEINYGSSTAGVGSLDFNTLVRAFKEALGDMTVELDDREVGKFVSKTVSTAIYYS